MGLNKYKIIHAVDSIKIADAAGDVMAVNADGSLNVVATATDLDIRDLTHVSDSVKVGDGVDFLAIAADGSIGVTQVGTWNVNLTDDSVADGAADTGNPFKVGGRSYSTATALTAVDSLDRFDLLGDLYRRIFTNDAMNVGWTHASIAVSTTAVQLDASKQAGRKKAVVQNRSGNNKSMFIGSSAAVIAGTGAGAGFEVPAGTAWEFKFGEALNIYAIGESGSSAEDIRIIQAA